MTNEKWDLDFLENHINEIGYGLTESASNEEIGPKFLRITDLNSSYINWKNVPYCKCSEKDMIKYHLRRDDIVFARIGATTGHAQIIRDDVDAVFASYLIRINLKETLCPEFFYQYTKTSEYWSQINAQKGAHLKGGINIPVLKKLRIPLPPLSEQQRIASILSAADKAIEEAEKRKVLLEKTKLGLMQKLLRSME